MEDEELLELLNSLYQDEDNEYTKGGNAILDQLKYKLKL